MNDAGTLLPLRLVGWGLLMVVFDFRFDQIDLIPDPLGWFAAALASGSLARRGIAGARAFGVAAVAAVLLLLFSLPDWVGAGDALLEDAVMVVHTAFVFATCTAIIAAAPPRASWADPIRWLDLGLTVAIVVLELIVDGPDAAGLLLVVGLLGLAVYVWFLVLLFSAAKLPGVPAGNDGTPRVPGPRDL